MMSKNLKVLIVGDVSERMATIREGLDAAGYVNVFGTESSDDLAARIMAIAPDIVVFDIGPPDRLRLQSTFAIVRGLGKPAVIFVDKSDSEMTAAAIEAGVSAYIVDGLKKDRIEPIVDMAVSRFQLFAKLESELKDTRAALAQRVSIDRAKGILMKQHSLTEEEAYAKLRNAAMNQNRKIADVAASLISAAELLV